VGSNAQVPVLPVDGLTAILLLVVFKRLRKVSA